MATGNVSIFNKLRYFIHTIYFIEEFSIVFNIRICFYCYETLLERRMADNDIE